MGGGGGCFLLLPKVVEGGELWKGEWWGRGLWLAVCGVRQVNGLSTARLGVGIGKVVAWGCVSLTWEQ